MSFVSRLVRAFVGQSPEGNPPDVIKFDEAKRRLKEASKNLMDEIDAFGTVVEEMQGISKKQKKRRR